MRGYFRFVLRHRVAVLIGCLAVTAAAAYGISTAVIASSIQKMFFGSQPRYLRYLERARRFASDEVFVIGYADDDALSRQSLERLRRVIDRVEAMPEVKRTDSLLSAQRVWSEGERTLKVERYAKLARDDPRQAATLLAALRDDEQVSGLLVSIDGKHAAVIIELEVNASRSAERTPELVTKVLDTFKAAGFSAERLHRAGIPSLMGEVISQTMLNLKVLLPMSTVLLVLIVLVLFRRFAPAVLVLAVSGLSVIWTMGFARLLDREFGIFMSVVPGMVLIVAFSDVIHLWSAYQIELARLRDKDEAILAAASDVGAACLLTSATTFAGFVCLSAIPTPIFRMLGVVLGFGVGIALLLAMTLVPIAMSLLTAKLPPPPVSTANGVGNLPHADWMKRLLQGLTQLASGRPFLVIGIFALLLAASLVGLNQLNIETEMSKRMSEDTSFRRDQQYFQRHFSGTNMVELYLDVPRDSDTSLTDTALFAKIARVQREIEALPQVDKVGSLVTLVEQLHRHLGGEGPLPSRARSIAQYLLLFEMSGGEDIERLIDFSRRSMRLSLRINDYGVRASYEAGLQAEEIARRILGAQLEVEASSMSFLMGWWLGSIVEGQQRGLALSFVLIAVMMIIGLRSLRVGLLSMIPNLLPLLSLGGFVALVMDRVDSDTLIVAMMAIGIGVDDTIHFLMRYRIESARNADRDRALAETFSFSGRAIVLTTVVLVVGFAPFALSDYYSVYILGTLLPGVLIVALAADLLLVPSLAKVGVLSFPRPPRQLS